MTAGDKESGYQVGELSFDVVFTVLTAGSTSAGKGAVFLQKISNFIKEYKTLNKVVEKMKSVLYMSRDIPSAAKKAFRCKILGKGCFVENTPVLIANKKYKNQYKVNFGNTANAVAVAASMPIMAVPIQEVELLDYAAAHKTVNAGFGLTASSGDDIYLGLIDKDPYTSDQQRERDKYHIDDEHWNEVVFEEVNGESIAKLALHSKWIKKKAYQAGAVVEMNLPEQGISGPFRITSIKHILPQKKPVDNDEGDDYDYQPVTGLFFHQSSQVYDISFDNGESLGVTYQHPVYSTTAGDWKLAGELEIGEEVLTKQGEATVTSSAKKEGQETVYNLEVRELHNFLVGNSGVVVHNLCYDMIKKRFKLNAKPGKKISGYHPEPGKTRKLKKQDENPLQQKADKDGKSLKRDNDGDLVICYDDFGFPDFRDYIPKIDGLNGKFEGMFNIGSMTGNNYSDFKSALEMMKTQLPQSSPLRNLTANDVPFDIDGVKYTFHHHQDCKTMMLVPSSVNGSKYGGAPHVGGSSMSKALPQEDIDLFKEELDPSKTSKYKSKCN